MKGNVTAIVQTYKTLVCGLMATGLMASCNSDELMGIPSETFNPETHIGFSMPLITMGGPEISDMTTRGTTLEEFPNGGKFGVLGYLESQPENNAASSWEVKYQFLSPDIFNKKEVTYSDHMCSYVGLQPWSNITGAQYTFFAYYPYSGNGTFDYTTSETGGKGAPIFTYTMPFSGGDNDTERSNDLTEDAMVAHKENHTKVAGNVDFQFSHLLTAVRFKVNNYSDSGEGAGENGEDEDHTVYINSLTISGSFYRSMKIDFTPIAGAASPGIRTTNTNDRYSGTYHFLKDTDERLEVGWGESQPVGNGEGTTILLIPGPQTINGETITNLGIDVGFKCNFDFLGNEGKVANQTLNYNFEAGTLNTINLNFIGDSFTINVTSDNWENGSINGGDNEIIIQ